MRNSIDAAKRDIPGYEGLYQVSATGEVYSVQGWRKKLIVHHSGFVGLTLNKDNKVKYYLVHRLVAKVFLGMDDKDRVRHKDGDKKNNNADNLIVIRHKPKPPSLPPVDPVQRFWDNVQVADPDDCWLWTGALNGAGYGSLSVNKRAVMAHRFSWELHCSTIPLGMVVMHKCDTPRCVNPHHLEVGTYSDNLQDAIKKGRFRPGAQGWHRHIDARYMNRIKEMVEDSGIGRSEIVAGLIVFALDQLEGDTQP